MKTEETKIPGNEAAGLSGKFAELNEDDLEQVTGGNGSLPSVCAVIQHPAKCVSCRIPVLMPERQSIPMNTYVKTGLEVSALRGRSHSPFPELERSL